MPAAVKDRGWSCCPARAWLVPVTSNAHPDAAPPSLSLQRHRRQRASEHAVHAPKPKPPPSFDRSATGASEPQNMLYMRRVGSYGFASMEAMVEALRK